MGATVDWLESRNAGIEFNGVLKIETDLRNDLKANRKGSAPGLPYSSAHRSAMELAFSEVVIATRARSI
jgi:hypothetical protein